MTTTPHHNQYQKHEMLVLTQRLEAAKAEAERVCLEVDVTSSPTEYNQAIEALSRSISECVGAGLLPETTAVARAARGVVARMREQVQNAVENGIENVQHELSDAIRTAKQTRESGPLSECLHEILQSDDLLWRPCVALVKTAQELSKRLVCDAFTRAQIHTQM